MDGIILNKIDVNRSHVEFHFETRGKIKEYLCTDSFFIDYEQDVSGVPKSILTIPFVASLIPLMWLTNTVMWVEEIDRTFFDAIFKVQSAYQRLYFDYPLMGNLVPAKIVANNFMPERESLLLFSGGIDANTTYVRIRNTNPMLFNIQGWYKKQGDCDVAADADIRDISAFAQREGLDFAFAKSNFAVLVNTDTFDRNIKKKLGDSWWHGFQHSMAFISIAIPIAYLLKIEKIYIASSVPMGEYVKCASHVTTDSEFKFATAGGCVHDGSELTRQDKVHILADYAQKRPNDYPIRVCSFNDHNCCACDKCFRTILGIVAEGGDIKKFGFYIDGSLKEHFESLMEKRAQTFNIRGESGLHWPAIKKRMQENYGNIKEQQFVDWFLNYDFDTARKKALKNYYRNNLFEIIERKTRGYIQRIKKRQ